MHQPRFIYYAGKEWRTFNFEKGSEALFNEGAGEFIFYAGSHWRRFDFSGGLEALLASGETEYIYKAGTLWRDFDYSRAWLILEKEVTAGARWRALAMNNERWKEGIRELWKSLW